MKNTLIVKTKNTKLWIGLIGLATLSWSVSATTISGTDLSSLKYSFNGGVAQYVAGTPDVAQLSTTDSGLNGGTPTVYVMAANVGLSSLGTLSSLSASYHLASSSGGAGNQPYWLTYLYAPGGGYIGVLSMGGPDLNGSSAIHVFYDYATSPLSSDTYWGYTLSQLDGTTYGTTTFGQLGVYETGVEIGNWAIADNIPAIANIDSITISSVPDSSMTVALLGGSLMGLAAFRRKLFC